MAQGSLRTRGWCRQRAGRGRSHEHPEACTRRVLRGCTGDAATATIWSCSGPGSTEWRGLCVCARMQDQGAGPSGAVDIPDMAHTPIEPRLIPTVITWSHGGSVVEVQGSFDNWTTRTPLHQVRLRSAAQFLCATARTCGGQCSCSMRSRRSASRSLCEEECLQSSTAAHSAHVAQLLAARRHVKHRPHPIAYPRLVWVGMHAGRSTAWANVRSGLSPPALSHARVFERLRSASFW
jgi:hypothetical protein